MASVRAAAQWRRFGVAAWLVVSAGGLAPATGNAQEAPDPPRAAPESPAPSAAPPSPAPSPPKPVAASPAKPPAEAPRPTEHLWVRGEVRINYRTSPSNESTPLGVVKTGDRVGVLERRGSWVRVLIGESAVGWLPDSILDAVPPPYEHVAQLEARLAELQQNLDAAERDAASLRAQVGEASGKEAEREEEMRRLRDENRDLRAGERWPYLVTGAAILGIGFVLGRILFRGGSRRSYSRIR
jgi:hypothetical protein